MNLNLLVMVALVILPKRNIALLVAYFGCVYNNVVEFCNGIYIYRCALLVLNVFYDFFFFCKNCSMT